MSKAYQRYKELITKFSEKELIKKMPKLISGCEFVIHKSEYLIQTSGSITYVYFYFFRFLCSFTKFASQH